MVALLALTKVELTDETRVAWKVSKLADSTELHWADLMDGQ